MTTCFNGLYCSFLGFFSLFFSDQWATDLQYQYLFHIPLTHQSKQIWLFLEWIEWFTTVYYMRISTDSIIITLSSKLKSIIWGNKHKFENRFRVAQTWRYTIKHIYHEQINALGVAGIYLSSSLITFHVVIYKSKF